MLLFVARDKVLEQVLSVRRVDQQAAAVVRARTAAQADGCYENKQK
jgi:hypothetical protein